jgi:sugar O-acyltransferase (sialic acid O-acetyltransferase NeuD family)
MPAKVGSNILGYSIIGSDLDLPELIKKYPNVLITVGQIKSAQLRERLFNTAKQLGAVLPVIVSSLARVARSAAIGEGTVVMHQVVVNSNVVLGCNTIVNTGAILEHETCIGNHNHVSTRATINGNCLVGDHCFIGSGVVVNQEVAIPSNTIIGSGSLVLKDIKQSGVYFGTPIDIKH